VGAFAACGTAGATPDVHEGRARAVSLGSLTAQDVAAAQTAFGVDLLHVLCGSPTDGNVLVSPTSAAEALSLLYPAAGGGTAEAIGAMLHLPEWSRDLVAAAREHTRALAELSYAGDLDDDEAPDSLRMTNRLWTVTGLEPEPAYLDDVATAFDSDVRSLDFAGDPEGATERINTTVEDDTAGIIEDLFEDPLRPDTVAVLTNALYLQARWATPFSDTRSAAFDAPSGESTVDMMSGGSGDARSAGGWQSVELPYRDGTLAAVAVLPPEGTDPCAVAVDDLAALEAAPPAPVGVELPRISIEQTHALVDPLVSLGMPPVGDYPGLGRRDLVLSEAVQKTFIEVDEQGTEAAAATGIGLAESAGPSEFVTFDRPFLFAVTDTATRSPLFTAVVRDPAA
jgi:serpin B